MVARQPAGLNPGRFILLTDSLAASIIKYQIQIPRDIRQVSKRLYSAD